ncbi:DUF4145 domain-containing protein, partial [Acinetobacter baumannii]
MVCRKLLMAVACQHDAEEGQSFKFYVEHLLNRSLVPPHSRAAVDAIRDIGNDANPYLAFVERDQARRAMQITSYLMITIYSLPTA